MSETHKISIIGPYLKLLRTRDWIKNWFLFIPFFFAGKTFLLNSILSLLGGFVCFSLVASGIYILNDLKDINSDQLHPVKKDRPLASGKVTVLNAWILLILLWIMGLSLSYFINHKFAFILSIYWIMNIAYSFGLKKISILDILIISIGFILRVKAGGAISNIYITNWLTIMIFLLSLILAIAKRRDDILLNLQSGIVLREANRGYNLDFLNIVLGLISSITIVSYLMYTLSPEVMSRHHNSFRLYYTCIFVLAGVLRYLQITFVESNSGSPTQILYKDKFIQICILLWVMSFYFILYVPDINLFNDK